MPPATSRSPMCQYSARPSGQPLLSLGSGKAFAQGSCLIKCCWQRLRCSQPLVARCPGVSQSMQQSALKEHQAYVLSGATATSVCCTSLLQQKGWWLPTPWAQAHRATNPLHVTLALLSPEQALTGGCTACSCLDAPQTCCPPLTNAPADWSFASSAPVQLPGRNAP
jgi:hypothetical protein